MKLKNSIVSQSIAPVGKATQGGRNSLCRILLVDDDHDLRSFSAALLVQSGYHVDTAGDGASGWRALKDHDYDVLITDNTMPGVTGLELIKKLRSEEMTLPVIMASGTAPTEELSQNPWLHIDAILQKPYTMTELVKTVDEVLQKSSAAPLTTTRRQNSKTSRIH